MRRRLLIIITSPIWVTATIGVIIAAQVMRIDAKASRGKRPQ